MDKINILSCFQNSCIFGGEILGQVERYFSQIKIQVQPPFSFQPNFFFLEDGSSDDTFVQLLLHSAAMPYNCQVRQLPPRIAQDAPRRDRDRLGNISSKANYLLSESRTEPSTYTWWLESDLIIKDELLLRQLIFILNKNPEIGAATALVELDNEKRWFYDIWCFKAGDGSGWSQEYPYNQYYHQHSDDLYIPMLGVGSCVLFRTELLDRGLNFGKTGFFGFSEQMIALQSTMVLANRTRIFHPGRYCVKGRWI